MYQGNLGPVLPIAGVAALPNTGGNQILLVASIATIVIGLAIVLSTVVRHQAKKAYKA